LRCQVQSAAADGDGQAPTVRVKETRFDSEEESADYSVAAARGDAHAASGDMDGYIAVLEALDANAVAPAEHNIDGDFPTLSC